jgi:hypothetical protein
MKRTSRRPRRNPSPLDNPAFRRWFGDSKVVDERGEPLVVYHGTAAGRFESFRPHVRKGEQLGFGIHFADEEGFARGYAYGPQARRAAKGSSPAVYAVFLSIQNPLDVERIVSEGTDEFRLAQGLAGKRLVAMKDERGIRVAYLRNAIELATPERAQAAIQAAGYDGIRYSAGLLSPSAYGWERGASSPSWIAFSPTQIKSATDNVGTYDPSDPSILKNRRTSRPRRNPELLKKGTRLTGSFADDGTGWRYSGDYPSVRGQRWVASLGLSRGELSVEGATEYDPGFRSSLVQMAAEYPELLDLDAKFDGPRIPVAALVQSGVPTIDRTLWLHGTSSAVLDSVMASGLRPRRETGAAAVFVGAAKESRPQYVYLTTQRNMARMAARAAARASGGVPVVLRVEPLPVGRMQPDEDSGTETAEESLWRIGSVAYEGSIAPGKIAVDEVLKDGEWSAPVSGNRRTSRRPRRTSRRRR